MRPVHVIARLIAALDRNWIDWLIDSARSLDGTFRRFWEWLSDKKIIDALVDGLAHRTLPRSACRCERVQTGRLRQYVMFLVQSE